MIYEWEKLAGRDGRCNSIVLRLLFDCVCIVFSGLPCCQTVYTAKSSSRWNLLDERVSRFSAPVCWKMKNSSKAHWQHILSQSTCVQSGVSFVNLRSPMNCLPQSHETHTPVIQLCQFAREAVRQALRQRERQANESAGVYVRLIDKWRSGLLILGNFFRQIRPLEDCSNAIERYSVTRAALVEAHNLQSTGGGRTSTTRQDYLVLVQCTMHTMYTRQL